MQALSGNLQKAGYVVVGPVISEAECDHYSGLVDMLDGGRNRALLELPWCRALSEILKQKLIMAVPELEGCSPVQCTLFRKTVKNNWLVSTHQDKSLPFENKFDQAYGEETRVKDGVTLFQPPEDILKNVIAIRLSLDASNISNGPLRVLVGTHDKGILDFDAIETEKTEASQVTPEIQRGGVLCIKPLVLHASSKSITEDPRRVLHYVYRAFH